MIPFRTRRTRNILLALLSLGACLIIMERLDQQLIHMGYGSGYVLAVIVLFLAAYSLRKRLPFLPWGSSATWLQIHLYVAAVALPIFGWHVHWRIPNGYLETTLATTFLFTWLSGLFGIYITRLLPKQLTQMGNEFLAEEIPWFTAQVRAQAYDVARNAHRVSPDSTISEYYLHELFAYFERPRSLLYIAYPTSRRRRQLQNGLHDLDRYLGIEERPWRDRMMELVQRKDDLDFRAARQALLRLWFFVHIGSTMMLLVLGTAHGVLAFAFRGNA